MKQLRTENYHAMKNLLSIDFEAWFHFLGDSGAPKRELWSSLDTRLERNTELLLKLLNGLSATFFVLGWVAERHPDLIRKLSEKGHEIACHGYSHELIFQLGYERFREDLRRAKGLLEDTIGKPVFGYRAPGFSIRKSEIWALEVIREEGFLYDSSIFPALRTMGGIDGYERFPQILKLRAGALIELPVSTALVWGKPIAFCGGGFFRFCPIWLMKKEIEKLNKIGIPAVMYVHPQDLDPEQPRMNLQRLHYFLYYYGLRQSVGKFKTLLSSFQWQGFFDYTQTLSKE